MHAHVHISTPIPAAAAAPPLLPRPRQGPCAPPLLLLLLLLLKRRQLRGGERGEGAADGDAAVARRADGRQAALVQCQVRREAGHLFFWEGLVMVGSPSFHSCLHFGVSHTHTHPCTGHPESTPQLLGTHAFPRDEAVRHGLGADAQDAHLGNVCVCVCVCGKGQTRDGGMDTSLSIYINTHTDRKTDRQTDRHTHTLSLSFSLTGQKASQ